MTEIKWVAVLWFTGCGWNCDAPPTFPLFDSKEDCERIVKEWVAESRNRGGWMMFLYEGQRHGECRPYDL
jgi:hypothetical protein